MNLSENEFRALELATKRLEADPRSKTSDLSSLVAEKYIDSQSASIQLLESIELKTKNIMTNLDQLEQDFGGLEKTLKEKMKSLTEVNRGMQKIYGRQKNIETVGLNYQRLQDAIQKRVYGLEDEEIDGS